MGTSAVRARLRTHRSEHMCFIRLLCMGLTWEECLENLDQLPEEPSVT